jgi:hypothetical protein
MRKLIKKILNLIGWLLLSLLILSVVLSIVINIPKVQNRITSAALEKVEALFGNYISYSDVRLRLFNRAEFDGLLIRDLSNDTLVYASKLKASFPGIFMKLVFHSENQVRLGKLEFEDSYFRLYNDSTNTINLKFIPDVIKTLKKTENSPEPFLINKISIENSRLDIHQYNTRENESGIDLTQLSFTDFNLEVADLRAFLDTVQMNVQQLSFLEQSGFKMNEFSTNIEITEHELHFNKVDFETAGSKMAFKYIHFDFDSFKDFANGGIIDKVRISLNASQANLNIEELRYFSPVFREMDNNVEMSGIFYGTISNLNARDLNLSFGESSYLKGSFDITGLPDANSTFLIFNINDLKTTTKDITNFKLPKNKYIQLPRRFSEISYYSYRGNFTGFFKDFVSYGSFETDIGGGRVDILFRPDLKNTVSFSGKLATDMFNLGALTGKPEVIGNIRFNLNVDGKGTIDKGFDVDLSGEIDEFEVLKYKYKDITIDGSFAENKFNGNVDINDPNLRLKFDGLLDLSSEIRQYNFSANVLNANIYNLNLNKLDPNYTVSFLLNANLSGNSLDKINGDIKLLNSLFSKSDAQIQVYDLELKVRNDSLMNYLVLKSDFLDGEIKGHYELTHLVDEYLFLANTFIPSLGLYKSKPLLEKSDFIYNVHFKNSAPLFAYFTPQFSINPDTRISGELKRGENQKAKLHVESPEIRFNKTKVTNLVLNSFASDSLINIDFGCAEINLSKRITLENLTFTSSIDSNRVDFSTNWLNWDSTLNKGNVSGQLTFLNQPGQKIATTLDINKSQLIISDSVWVISPFNFSYDSNSVNVNNFKVSHKSEHLIANGALFDNSVDSLNFDFNNFDFSNLNFFTRSSTFKFGGILNGKATVIGYSKPLFFASLFVQDLAINKELIGDTYIKTSWNDARQNVEIDANVLRGKLKTLNINGKYYPTTNGELNLDLKFDKFRLNFINPYLNNVFSDIQGLATGLITLTGTGKEPKLNGVLNLQKAALTVDYLQTRYNFTSEVSIINNNIVFDGVELYDKYINSATLNGVVRSEFFKDFNLNLNIQPRDFLCLSTTREDNKSFFGNAFATGLIRINGPVTELKFDIKAKTEPGTEFSIPLSDSEELGEYDFIKIKKIDTLSIQEEKEEYKVQLTGMQLDFDLNITPDAEVKIIFDPTMGDEITTRGNGNLRIAINAMGEFKMLGDYVIESGTYLFTLKDFLINKKFKVEEGSNLRWTGDPINANININTFYRTKASLSDLTGDQTSSYRTTVDCQLSLTGKLMEPEIGYNIFLPYAEQEQRNRLAAEISSNEKMGKQFLSLLVLNRFLYNGNQEKSGLENSNIAGVNASELLSNQLSNWLSQISDEVDIGVNYRPGSELNPQELELALSTQLLNDRLSINGSVDMKTNAEAENANNVLGNLDLDYKITRNGKIRARAYNRANDNEIINYSKYTQGIGVFYTEEFDKFNEIGSWYRKGKSSKKNEREKTPRVKESAIIRNDENIEIE